MKWFYLVDTPEEKRYVDVEKLVTINIRTEGAPKGKVRVELTNVTGRTEVEYLLPFEVGKLQEAMRG